MSIVLELPPELESELAAEAARLRLPLAEYAVRVLARGRVQKESHAQGVAARLGEFRQLADGWLEGRGKSPSHAGLDWLADAFARGFSADLVVPHLYPTADGGIQAEWTLGHNDVSLEIDLASHQGHWHCLNLESDHQESRNLDLNADHDWGWVAGQLRVMAGGAR